MLETKYKEKELEIEAAYTEAKKQLYIKFALSNALFKKGDIIKNHRVTMLIDRITVSKSLGLPEPVYTGFELKKDLTPRKDQNRVSIYGNKGELVKPL